MLFRSRRFRVRRGGYAFAVTSVLVLMAAWNTGINLLFFIFGGLVSFLLVSLFASLIALRKIELQREVPYAVHRGAVFSLTISIRSKRKRSPAYSIRVEETSQRDRSIAFITKLAAGESAVVRVKNAIEKRGVHKLSPLEMVCSFPFGLIERRKRIDDGAVVVVYPRISSVRTAALENAPGTGDTPQLARVDGTEYFSMREYAPGDDVRRIAWRASARLDSLIVKDLEQETTKNLTFLLDTREASGVSDFEDRFEDAVELVASLAATMLNRQYSVSIITPTTFLPDGEGKAQLLKVLDILARVQPLPDTATDVFSVANLYDAKRGACLFISANPQIWGRTVAGGMGRVLDPREMLRA